MTALTEPPVGGTNPRKMSVTSEEMSHPSAATADPSGSCVSTADVVALVGRSGVVRARDLVAAGASRSRIYRLAERGDLIRVGRGLYAVESPTPPGEASYVEVVRRAPSAVICLLSALAFHGLTTQAPSKTWIAIGPKAWRPQITWPPVRVVRFSGPALSDGVEEHARGGVTIRVYSAAKTVADCFKYRNKVGLDVAIEALRDALRKRQATVDELSRYARVCRVANVMRPYLEATL